MTSPEDLRALLHAAVEDVQPRGDGLARIQSRLVRRRRTRWVLLPSAALATTAAVVAAFVLTGSSPDQTLTVQPGGPSATAEPTPEPTAFPATATYDGPMVWPFASSPAPADWRARYPYADDPRTTAERFLRSFLALGASAALSTADVPPAAGNGADFGIDVADRRVGVVHLESLGTDGPWTVTLVNGTDVQVDSPAFGESVGDPVHVQGRLDRGVDESVVLRLLTTDGREVAQGSAMAGSEEPWSADLRVEDGSWTAGAVVGFTTSAKDGAVTRLFAQPVVRGSQVSPEQYAVLRAGHVELLDVSGRPARTLTYPPAGSRDRALAYSSGRLLWVRQFAECDQSLLQLVDGTAAILRSHVAMVKTPRLSASGAVAAWVEGECGDGDAVLHIGSRSVPAGGFDALVDVDDEGAVLFRHDGPDGLGNLLYLPPGATRLDQGVDLTASVGCPTLVAGTFDDGITAWESCKDGRSRLVRFAPDGSRLDQGPPVEATDVQSAAATAQGQLLTVGNRSGGTVVARYRDGALTYLSDCGNDDSCFSDADW